MHAYADVQSVKAFLSLSFSSFLFLPFSLFLCRSEHVALQTALKSLDADPDERLPVRDDDDDDA